MIFNFRACQNVAGHCRCSDFANVYLRGIGAGKNVIDETEYIWGLYVSSTRGQPG